MKKYLQKKLNNEKGMTLIELLAVIVIIAIIAAIAIPAIGTIIENSRNGAVKADYQNALSAANIYFTENPGPDGTTTVSVETLAGGGATTSYLEDQGSLENDVTITKQAAGNTVSGEAIASGDTYEVTGLTNSQLSDIPNANFNTDQVMDSVYVASLTSAE